MYATHYLPQNRYWVVLNQSVNSLHYTMPVDLFYVYTLISVRGGAVASRLVRSTLERAVQVQTLTGDMVLCSWERHFILTVPLSTQMYKWVLPICWGNLTKFQGSDLWWTGIPSRGSRILLATSCYRNRDKFRQLWTSLGSKASLFGFLNSLPCDLDLSPYLISIAGFSKATRFDTWIKFLSESSKYLLTLDLYFL